MKRPAAVLTAGLVAGTLALAGCGDGRADATGAALRRTAAGLDDVRSGEVVLQLAVTSPGAKRPVGFRVTGVFALPKDGGLPVADLRWTSLSNVAKPVRIVSDGTAVRVVTADGRSTPLPDDAAAALRTDGAGGGTLRIDGWLRDPRRTDGGTIGGTRVTRVDAGVDVPAVLRDVVPLARSLGSPLGRLGEREQRALAAAVRRATLSVWSGADDGLLRRLVVRAEVAGGERASELPSTLRALLPLAVEFDLTLTRVNEAVG